VVISFAYSYNYSQHRGLFQGEFFVLGLFAVLGMSVMISSGSFITVFLGLELLSLPLYTMVALDRRSSRAYEAAMRYFVRGTIASGVLLYGVSLLYGATGSINLIQVSDVIQRLVTESSMAESMNQNQILAILGMIFVVGGLSFKFSALPLHILIFSSYRPSEPIPVKKQVHVLTPV
jgi:NADH-quinone oxidoreductase subunit N